MSRIPAQLGLTLVELMVALAVLVVVLALAVPSLARLQDSFQIRSASHRLAAAVNLARNEALLRGQSVALCPSPGGHACTGDYSEGWLLFNDADRDGQLDADSDQVILHAPGLPEGFTVTDRSGLRPAVDAIVYSADGSTLRSQTLLLCASRGRVVEPRALVLSRVGRLRIARGEGQCPGVQG